MNNQNDIKCSKQSCNELGKLRCPTCKKYDVKEGSYFCGKECFNSCWSTHKKNHEDYEPINDGFPYTGKLRRYKVTQRREIPLTIQKPDYANHKEGKSKVEEDNQDSKIIPIYSKDDIEKMREVCKIGRKILDIAHKAIKIGIRTDEIDRIVHEACIEYEVYPSPLNYYKFPKSVCTSVNEIICHGIPDMRQLEDGDIINIDISVYKNGFHSDLNETYLVGNVKQEDRFLVESAYECLQKAISICKPGTMYKEIGEVIGEFIEGRGLSVTKTYCGHGIGREFHCNPNVPHYRKNKTVGIMRPGHIFTIEPMINQGSWKDVTWLDDWTASTVDGKNSAQFEHTILITDNGCEVLTARLEDSPKLEIEIKDNQ
jgi:methionyl aminopeptidase